MAVPLFALSLDRRLRRAVAGASAAVLGLIGAPAAAQVVERNLPPAAAPSAGALPLAAQIPSDADDTSLGVTLGRVRLEGASSSAAECAGIAVDAGVSLDLRGRRRLQALMGAPLSRKRIAQARAAVVESYRRAGRPFVSVTTPPQELTSGVLRLRVMAYRLGALQVSGAAEGETARVRGQVRGAPGEPVDASVLAEDLSWLNRTPFRSVAVVAAPGRAAGDVDLDLRVTPQRPWRAYAGAATSDSPASGDARLFVGAQAGVPFGLGGAWAGYQFTASPDQSSTATSRYRSHAGRVDMLVAPRLLVELTVDRVESLRTTRDFLSAQTVSEAALSLRAPFSAVFGTRAPFLTTAEVIAGVEARRAERQVSFGGVVFQRAAIDVYQLRAGLEGVWESGGARAGGSLLLHVSPGGLGAANTHERFTTYAFGDTVSARYAYTTLSAFAQLPLGGGRAYLGEVLGQVSTGRLPDTEKAGVGGADLVRGAVLEDGAFSRQIVLRNTLSGRAWRVGSASLRPHIFADAGFGAADADSAGRMLVSAGLGGEARMAGAALNADLACAASRGGYTRAGDCRTILRLTAAY